MTKLPRLPGADVVRALQNAGTRASILRAAGMTGDELRKLL